MITSVSFENVSKTYFSIENLKQLKLLKTTQLFKKH